ncbi:MAG TPA: lysylphosphatidylglycerol synthase domain-containing protein [Stellaceae bacterium]
MRTTTVIAWAAGICGLIALILFNDPSRLLDSVAALRWWLIAIIAWHVVPIFIDARAWQLLFAAPARPPLRAAATAIWVAEGVNGLFPVPHLGEIARARLVRRFGAPGEAGASVVVDLTLGISMELIFALLGVALFSTVSNKLGILRVLAPAGALIAACALAFFLLQRAGLFALAGRIAHRWSETARRSFNIESAEALDAAVRGIYRRRRALIGSTLWRLAGWVAGAGETWLVFYALGMPIGFGEAIAIESLGHAARTAAFIVPGGLGVQDGALLLLGAAAGLGPDAGLVLALTKRLRELVLGIPALVAGYVIETRQPR